MNNNKKVEYLKNVLLGVGCALLIVAFVVLYVHYAGVKVSSKVYVNYVPDSYTVTGSSSATFVDAVKDAKQSVVEINSALPNGTSAGSGVMYGTDGNVTYIVTNFHVIENATQFKVILYDGTIITDVQLVGGDDEEDIAVLMIEGTYKTAKIRQVSSESANAIKLGETVFAIGNPLGKLGGSVTKGIISCLNREIVVENKARSLMQTDVAINSGNSGGGLFDENGNLIGIVNAKVSATGVEGIAFAISIDNAVKVANELIESHTHDVTTLKVTSFGFVKGRIELGFEASYTALMSGFFITEKALYVTSCDSNLQAYASGLRQYDKIISISKGGKENAMNSDADFTTFISTLKVGDKISVKVSRNSETKSFEFAINQKIYSI